MNRLLKAVVYTVETFAIAFTTLCVGNLICEHKEKDKLKKEALNHEEDCREYYP